jgi:hypothetical protein
VNLTTYIYLVLSLSLSGDYIFTLSYALLAKKEMKLPLQFVCYYRVKSTRWFKYDRDKLWLVDTQIVPVIFETPCTSSFTPSNYADIRYFNVRSTTRYHWNFSVQLSPLFLSSHLPSCPLTSLPVLSPPFLSSHLPSCPLTSLLVLSPPFLSSHLSSCPLTSLLFL